MAIASGTSGTCTWSIDDSGNLTVRPTSGTSGYLLRGWLLFGNDLPWAPYADRIKTITFSGSIRIYQETYGGGVEETGDARYMFAEYYNSSEKTWTGYTLLTEITGLSCLKGLTNMFRMFKSCVALPYIDLTGVDTSYVKDMDYMFYNCDLLTSVKLSNTFDTSLAKENGKKFPDFGKGTNQTNGIVVQNDADFMDLTAAEHAGTWQRNVAPIFKAEANRSESGTADEGGNDATLKVTWASQASTTTRSLKIYKKLNSASSYPATPDVNETLSGNSGVEQVTIASLGDNAFDFKVEFYDGTNTFIAFPSIQSNIRLITIDPDGKLEVYLDVDSSASKTTAATSGKDKDLFNAIRALGWYDDVIS